MGLTIRCSNDSGMGVLAILAYTATGEHIIHQSTAMPLNPKDPITKAEIAWAAEKTGAAYGDLYDAIRHAMRTRRS